MPTGIETAVTYTAGGTLGAALIVWFVRLVMKTYRTDRLEATLSDADQHTVKRLQGEIERLNKEMVEQRDRFNSELAAQRRRTDEVERRLGRLRDIEMAGAADMGMLVAYIESMPCGKCQAPDDTFAHIEEILNRIIARRGEKSALLSKESSQEAAKGE